jgi:predicted Zn-dependent protease
MGSRIINSKIFVSRRSFNNTVMSNTEIYTIMLHEIGHSLGLGHSENKTSIMFKGTNRTLATKQEILDEDIQTLYKLYGF